MYILQRRDAKIPGFSISLIPGIFWKNSSRDFLIPGFFALSFGIPGIYLLLKWLYFISVKHKVFITKCKHNAMFQNTFFETPVAMFQNISFRTPSSEHLFQNTCFKTPFSEHLFQNTCFWTTVSEHLLQNKCFRTHISKHFWTNCCLFSKIFNKVWKNYVSMTKYGNFICT